MDYPVREISRDDGIEICTRMIQHPGSNEMLMMPGL